MNRLLLFTVLLSVCFLGGCTKAENTSYEVPVTSAEAEPQPSPPVRVKNKIESDLKYMRDKAKSDFKNLHEKITEKLP